MSKKDGQIWLGNESPHVLKYQAGNTEYWTVAANTYLCKEAVKKGQLVASKDGGVVPAIYPRDADRLMGMALNSAAINEQVRVVNYGYVSLSADEIPLCFVTQSDWKNTAADVEYYTDFGTDSDGGSGNGWEDSGGSYKGRGVPIYWFVGRTYKTGVSTYAYADPSAFKGKMTFSTPSGYPNSNTFGDASLQVGYEGLPVIGSVVDYEYSGSKVTSLIININIPPASSTIGFNYPKVGMGQYVAPSEMDLPIRHGLFPNDTAGNSFFKQVLIDAVGYSDTDENTTNPGETFPVMAAYDSYMEGDKRTVVQAQSDSSFYYKISGRVSYTL
jgi:hypothetical protein